MVHYIYFKLVQKNTLKSTKKMLKYYWFSLLLKMYISEIYFVYILYCFKNIILYN